MCCVPHGAGGLKTGVHAAKQSCTVASVEVINHSVLEKRTVVDATQATDTYIRVYGGVVVRTRMAASTYKQAACPQEVVTKVGRKKNRVR